MLFEIKSWLDGGVLFSLETDSLKLCVEAAVRNRASLDRARLDGASLDGASLVGASLDRASLVGASLVCASLVGARLDGASLDGARLDGARLVGASLVGASLDGASLDRASLDRARLVGARLDGASLDGASLDRARLVGASLDGASGLERFPIQIGGTRHWLITTQSGELQIGCHVHTFEYWLKNAERIGKIEGYSEMEVEIYKLHIQHIEKVSRLLWNAKQEEKAEAVKA